ncbi:hypothetical protein M2419_003375 [Sphingobacterium sp. BIGb0116]|nr:hypothetical protein [Sphingobacterium sp. BIGb0116]
MGFKTKFYTFHKIKTTQKHPYSTKKKLKNQIKTPIYYKKADNCTKKTKY